MPCSQGKLADGTEFDNSFSRGEPIEFKLGAQEVRLHSQDSPRLKFDIHF